jgi:uncharacterized protein
MDEKPKPKRGFASLSPERLREIASRGGKNSGGNFKKNTTRAAESGRKGGLAVASNDRYFSRDRNTASTAGKKGNYNRYNKNKRKIDD